MPEYTVRRVTIYAQSPHTGHEIRLGRYTSPYTIDAVIKVLHKLQLMYRTEVKEIKAYDPVK